VSAAFRAKRYFCKPEILFLRLALLGASVTGVNLVTSILSLLRAQVGRLSASLRNACDC
jgi:hypothetical protein